MPMPAKRQVLDYLVYAVVRILICIAQALRIETGVDVTVEVGHLAAVSTVQPGAEEVAVQPRLLSEPERLREQHDSRSQAAAPPGPLGPGSLDGRGRLGPADGPEHARVRQRRLDSLRGTCHLCGRSDRRTERRAVGPAGVVAAWWNVQRTRESSSRPSVSTTV